MRTWFNILVSLMLAIASMHGQTASDCDVLDMRSGLPENRVRFISQLSDGRIAIATAGTIALYDGTRFTTFMLHPEHEYVLADYMGKRHVRCDSTGLLWLRNTRSLYVLDTRRGRMVTNVDSLMRACGLSARKVTEWPVDTDRHVMQQRQAISQAIGKEVSALLHDSYGGLWIGTLENGVYYYNPQRKKQFRCTHDEQITTRQQVYCSPRGSELAAKYAHQSTNCTLEADGYLYIGTREGVLVVDRSDSLVAVIGQDYGLLTNNVAALISDSHGDVWAATAGGGITRLHRTGHATFDIVNYGPLDGVQTEGMEFRTCNIRHDSNGFIQAGFVGGTCSFCPDSVKAPRYTFHYAPQPETVAANKQSDRNAWLWLGAVGGIVVVCAVLGLTIRKSLRRHDNSSGAARNMLPHPAEVPQVTTTPADHDTMATAMAQKIAETSTRSVDDLFMEKINMLVDRHLGDEHFSVQTLSELMAMDRTVLYRRMQTVTGLSPSVYIKQMRLGVAKQLLRDTDMPIRDIAFKTGFATVKYFSTVFKESTGQLPNDYRRLTSSR